MGLHYRANIREQYSDILHPAACEVIEVLASFDQERQQLMADRIALRARRARAREPIAFLDPRATVPGTSITVAQARAGAFEGSAIPQDLQCQWVQGTGPGARPRSNIESNLRNVAYALLSGADGWMFDGEDALGQLSTMSLDNQRSLKIAFAQREPFARVAQTVAAEMNTWAGSFFGRAIITDWREQCKHTTRIFRPRGLHLDDRHVRAAGVQGLGASIVDAALYVANNQAQLRSEGRSIVLYLPKIQTAGEAAFWHRLLGALESQLALPVHCIKTYVLVEQLEAAFQLMEIRAALGGRFVGFNTGRWDYINSVSDARAWDREFCNPNIDAITMTYGYMGVYEDRVRRAVNTADQTGKFALWQGGMEPNIPVGSAAGVASAMERALGGARREQSAGASGKWVAHWKMVHIVRPVWEEKGARNQLGRPFAELTYTASDAAALTKLDPAPRTVRGARDLISVALQYGNAFGRGYQAAALKPADSFGDDSVLYLMEDAATGEIRLSILWEWLHKSARLTEADEAVGVAAGDEFTPVLFARLLSQEYQKLLSANDRDVHEDSKLTTLPIAIEIVRSYVECEVKPPWYIDLLNLNLDDDDRTRACARILQYLTAFARDGMRTTVTADFSSETA